MPKGLKIALIILLPLLIIVGSAYGLAKVGLIPVPKTKLFRMIGLAKPTKPGKAPVVANAPDPLAGQKKVLAAERDALNAERTAWESQRETARRADERAAHAVLEAAPDPRNVARLATVYEQMPTDSVTKIFAKLPDDQVIALLRGMEEKKVAQILAAVQPERAVRLTLALSRPAPPAPVVAAAAP